MYSRSIKSTEEDIQNILKRVNELTGMLWKAVFLGDIIVGFSFECAKIPT